MQQCPECTHQLCGYFSIQRALAAQVPSLWSQLQKGKQWESLSGPPYNAGKTSELPLLPQILSCATAMPYTFESLTTDLILWFGPRPSPSPGLYLWSLGWGWSSSLLPFLTIYSYSIQWSGTLQCAWPPAHFLSSLPHICFWIADPSLTFQQMCTSYFCPTVFGSPEREIDCVSRTVAIFHSEEIPYSGNWRQGTHYGITKVIYVTQNDCV